MTGSREDLRLPADAPAEAAQPVIFTVDGEDCTAYPGDTIAAALYASGVRAWRRARSGEARGLLCGMGVCLDCLVTVDGFANQRACQVEARAGMVVRTGLAAPTGGAATNKLSSKGGRD